MNLPRRTSAPEHAIFYFDFRDPYAYLAAMRVPRLCEAAGFTLTSMPIDSLALGHRGGMTGSSASSHVREYVWRDVQREAARIGVPFRVPTAFPFDAKPLLRTCVFVKERSGQEAMMAVADSLWHEIWERGSDPEDCATVLRAAGEVAIPESALREAHDDLRIDVILERQTARAAQRGVFTVPALEVANRLYSGLEDLGRLEAEVRATPLAPAEGKPGSPARREGEGPGVPDWTFSG